MISINIGMYTNLVFTISKEAKVVLVPFMFGKESNPDMQVYCTIVIYIVIVNT